MTRAHVFSSSITLASPPQLQDNDRNGDALPATVASGASVAPDATETLPNRQHSVLADVEVRRRLRRLGHPVTLFGDTTSDRHERYRHVERTFEVTDEGAVGGESANVLLTIQKEDRLKAKEAAMQSGTTAEDDKTNPPTQQGNGSAEEEVRACFVTLTRMQPQRYLASVPSSASKQ